MSICSDCFPSFLQTSCWNYYGVIKRNNVFYLPGVVSHKWPLALASCAKTWPLSNVRSLMISIVHDLCVSMWSRVTSWSDHKSILSSALKIFFFLFPLSSATADNDDSTPVTKGGTISTAPPSLCLETSLHSSAWHLVQRMAAVLTVRFPIPTSFKCPPELDFTQSVSKYSLLLFYLFFFVILAAVSTLWVISYAFLCISFFFLQLPFFMRHSAISMMVLYKKKKCPKSLSHLFFFSVPTRFLLDRIILNNG